MKNYGVAARSITECIPYKQALHNLIVIMFSHHVGSLENSRSMEGHWMLVVHECLIVASALGWYHWWECQVKPEDWDNPDWEPVSDVPGNNFWHKYSSTLQLLGSSHHPAFAHYKLLGRCYDNVYHQGRLISDLPAHGKPPTKDQTIKIYNQEYAKTIGHIENSLDLTSLSHRGPILTSLVNPDIVLHPKKYRETLNQLPPALGRLPVPLDYHFDKAVRLVDLAWSERVPGIVKDDIDRDTRYNQYPIQTGDNYNDEEEEMDIEDQRTGYPMGYAHGN